MQQVRINLSVLILLTGLLVGSPVVFALEVEPGVGVGLLYTDNARLSDSNEKNDLVVVGYAGVRVDENSGPLNVSAEAEWIHLNYTRDTFGKQDYPGLRLTAGWEQIRDRLDWQVQNYFTQTLGDSLDGATPDNIENSNVFTFGPNIRFPISGRQMVTVNPEYRNFYYENGDNNQQYALSAGWFYNMYRTTQVGLDGSVTEVSYSGDATDYTSYTAHAVLSGSGARSDYSLSLGGTDIDRDESGSTSGFSGNLTWSYKLTGHSSARAYLSSDITDTGNLLLDSQTNPDNGDFSNVQTSNDTVRNNILRLTYRRDDATLNTVVWGELRDLDYQGGQSDQDDQSDRDVWEVGADLNYNVTAALTAGISGRYTRTEETDTDRKDKAYSILGTVNYQLTRKLRTSFDLQYLDQDSDGDFGNEYSAFSSFVRLVYGFARVDRPGRGR